MIFAGIVAGGCGSRMKNCDKPKQFLEIGGKPVLIVTVESFLKVKAVDYVVVGVREEWLDYAKTLFEKYFGNEKRLIVTCGGSDRNDTVMKIVAAACEIHESSEDIILTHDAVRPFVTEKVILDNISCAKKYGACGTYIPSVDTIVRSVSGENADESLDRSQLFRAQTPQSFRVPLLIECYAKLNENERSKLTDTCSIITACGKQIRIVQGDELNFKITTENDLVLARAVMNIR